MRRSLIVAVFFNIILPCIVHAQTNQGSKAPEQKTFSLNPDGIQALQNSVNLLTGQVAFPMNLVSLPGKGGLNLTVSIQYNSAGVKKSVSSFNQYSPTGVLGLGWNLDLPRIVADNKLTGTRQDDNYFLVEGGTSNPLICISHTPTVCLYATKNYNFWTIQFYPLEEKWVITRENGVQYIYGDKNSGRNTVQWMVKWGNWIGNSTQPAGQQQTGYIWNLSQIQNLSGDLMTYEYDNADEFVANGNVTISSEQKHTKASYLKKITDPLGQSVELVYQDKAPAEYYDPHVEQPEPDAYQEKFESRYLSTLSLKAANNSTLYTVNFNYANAGANELTKRYLTSITKNFPSNESQPPTQFEYFDSGDLNGYLKRVSNSLGVHIDYYYQQVSIPNSSRNIFINGEVGFEDTGYGQPKAYTGSDYVVVTWRKLKADATIDEGPQPVKIFAYTWDGGWIGEEVSFTAPLTNTNYTQSTMLLEENLFAYRAVYGTEQYVLMAGKKKTTHVNALYGTDNWVVQAFYEDIAGAGDPNTTNMYLLTGENFVGSVQKSSGTIKTHIWHGEYWEDVNLAVDESPYENIAASGHNYIILHNDNGGNADKIHFYFLNEEKKWQETTLPSSVSFGTEGSGSGHESYWHATNSFAVVLPVVNPEYIYMWDENYSNFVKLNILGEWTDASPVPLLANSQFAISEFGGKGISARFDGVSWALKGPYTNYFYQNISFGEDFIIRDLDARTSPRKVHVTTYDPNNLTWNSDVEYIDDRSGSLNQNLGIDIRAGINMFSFKDGLLYQKMADGNWEYLDKVFLQAPPFLQIESLVGSGIFLMSPNFIAYEYSIGNSSASGVYVAFLVNNKITGFTKYPGYTLDELANNTGLNTVVLHNSNSFQLIRVVDGASSGNLTTTVASSLTWTDGNHVLETSYTYSNAKGFGDGQTAFFNKVTSAPGKINGTTPFGYTETYFHNGLPCGNLLSAPASCDDTKELLLTGVPYQTIVYNASGQPISTSASVFQVFDVAILNNNYPNPQIDVGHYVRSTQTAKTVDGITSSVNTTYNSAGFPASVIQTNSKSGSITEEIKTTYTYWYEQYDAGFNNILSPVIQTISYRNGIPQESSVTRWKQYEVGSSIRHYPDRSYVWLKSGDIVFTSWQDLPPPSSDWLENGHVNIMDASNGVVLEAQRADETITSVIYDAAHAKVLAQATYASYNQIAFTSFDDNANGNWQYNTAMVVSTDALVGVKSFYSQQLSPGDPNYNYLTSNSSLPAGNYEMSYWTKGGTATVMVTNGSVIFTQTVETQSGWSLIKTTFQLSSVGSVQIKVPVNIFIDDVRLLPTGSVMTTNCYNDIGQLLATTDSNLLQTHYEYDGQYRLLAVRDHKRMLVKKYEYHYRLD